MSDFFSGKRVLVAGGTGTIGVPLVRQLIERGAKVGVVSLDDISYAKQVLHPDAEFVQADLTNTDICFANVRTMDIVFDMVGIKGSTRHNQNVYSRVLTSYLKFQTTLMDVASKLQTPRYLYAGSICSYPQMSIPKKEEDMWNGLPSQNDRFSGIAKRVGEFQALAYHEDGTWDGARIVRFSNVYGPYDDFNPETAQVIGALIAKAHINPIVPVHGSGDIVRDFLFAEDAAYWAMEAVEKLPSVTPVNIGSGHGTTLLDICHAINLFMPTIEFEFKPTSYSGDPVRILSVEKAKTMLKFFERTKLQEGIQKTIEWYRKNKDIASKKGKFYD